MSDANEALPSPEVRQAFMQAVIQIAIPASPTGLPSETTIADLAAALEEQRDVLYYDQIVKVLVVARTTLTPTELKDCLPYITTSTSAHLAGQAASANATPQPSGEHAIKLKLDTSNVADTTLVSILDSADYKAAVIFEAELHLRHPERPLARTSVQFTANITLKIPGGQAADPLDDYLPSGIAFPSNVLAGLGSSLRTQDGPLELPASRLERATPPLAYLEEDARPLRATSSPLPVRPAILLRTSRTLLPELVYLTLDVHVPQGSSHSVQITESDAATNGLAVEPCTPPGQPSMMLPGDRRTYVFKSDRRAASQAISFTLVSSMTLSDGNILALRSVRSLKAPLASQIPPPGPLKQWSHPRRISRAPTTTTVTSMTEHDPSAATSGELKVCISGPARMRVGDIFTLIFSIVNQSNRKRRLHILAPPPGSSADVRAKTSWAATAWFDNPDNVASAVVDPRELYAATAMKQERRRSGNGRIRKGAGAYRADVVPLDTEIKVGVLAAGACTEIRMQLQAVSVGVVSADGLIIVDVDSRETCMLGEGWEALCVEGE